LEATKRSSWANTYYSDILHPNRANISKDELRGKLGELYKASKDQVNVFGLRTQFGGGKTTGFALIYDSQEAMKKFEPHYRLVRVGMATKVEKPSRQQRTYNRALGPSPDIGRH
jgi:small subunit ribosomal protein S24e